MKDFMQQAQQMQAVLRKKQADLANLEVVGESGGAMVKVTLNGQYEACRVEIDPTLMNDPLMLADLIAAAITDASHKVQSTTQQQMSELLGGVNLPPGIKLPF